MGFKFWYQLGQFFVRLWNVCQ